jgi:hypothetical protein
VSEKCRLAGVSESRRAILLSCLCGIRTAAWVMRACSCTIIDGGWINVGRSAVGCDQCLPDPWRNDRLRSAICWSDSQDGTEQSCGGHDGDRNAKRVTPWCSTMARPRADDQHEGKYTHNSRADDQRQVVHEVSPARQSSERMSDSEVTDTSQIAATRQKEGQSAHRRPILTGRRLPNRFA